MTSSSPTYYEDLYTLQGMTEHFEFSEQLIRQIQKHGFMLPEIVKFGSAEIEIHSTLDRNMCRHVTNSLKEYDSLSQAIADAQAHIVEVYRVAHGAEPTEDSPDSAQRPSGIRRKKLYSISELLEALGINDETFQKIRQHIEIQPMMLLIPGGTIEYYLEDDYLKLRYIVTLIGQGSQLEHVVGHVYDWVMQELW